MSKVFRGPRTTALVALIGLCVGGYLTVPAKVASAAGRSSPVVAEEVPVTPVFIQEAVSNNSPSIATDPTNTRVLALAARTDYPDFTCTLHISGDGGRGWTPVFDRVPILPEGAEKCYGAEVGFDRHGTLYYLFVGLQGRANHPMGVFLITSSDWGKTFTSPSRVLGPHVYMPRMAIDRTRGKHGRIHVIWVQAREVPPGTGFADEDNPIMAAFSDDEGRTFSQPVRVSDKERPRVVAPAVAVGTRGVVHVLYYDLGDDKRDYQGLEGPPWEGRWSLVLATSDDGGSHFGFRSVADAEIVPPERIMLIFTAPPAALAADGTGRVFVSWSDARHGDWDVLLRRSDDGGRRWHDPTRLNDDPVGDARHQYLPRLAVSPDGRLDAIFYDRRGDPENHRNDVFYTFSEDGGRHFAPNVRLTSESSDARLGPTYPTVASATGLAEFGSQIGLVALRNGAKAAWTDTRMVEPGFVQQDIFATEVILPATAKNALAPVLVGTAVFILFIMAAAGIWLRRRRSSEDGARRPSEDVSTKVSKG